MKVGESIGDMHGCNWRCIQAFCLGDGTPSGYEAKALTKKIKTVVSFVEYPCKSYPILVAMLAGQRSPGNKFVYLVGENHNGELIAAYSYDGVRLGIATIILND